MVATISGVFQASNRVVSDIHASQLGKEEMHIKS